MENLINVSIYGDGSRKYPHEVKAIYCNRADECELYKAGKVADTTRPLATGLF